MNTDIFISGTIKPITPQEITDQKLKIFPEFVFEAFNQLLAEKFVNRTSKVNLPQKEVIDKIISLSGETINRTDIFENGYLNVEQVYRDSGWIVDYHKPSYADMFDAYFEFRAK